MIHWKRYRIILFCHRHKCVSYIQVELTLVARHSHYVDINKGVAFRGTLNF